MGINKKSNNFDFLRLFFAITVAIVHAEMMTQIEILRPVSLFLDSEIAVDSFFVISGFLIFMSFDSSPNLNNYLTKRIRRIFPGYCFVILLCAFFLFFVSTEKVTDYFTLEFVSYLFFNLLTLNFIQPTLPGVFSGHTFPVINGALWTIKIEVLFYLFVPFIAYLLTKFNKMRVLILIYFLSILYSTVMLWLSTYYDMEIFIRLERQLPGQLAFFISGAFLYYYYSKFHNNALLILAVSVTVLILHKYVIDIYILYPASLAGVVIYFALIFKYLGNFGKIGDLSFGIYIWHFPIIQLFILYDLFVNPVMGLSMLVLSIFLFSFLSWHGVEKKFLFKSSHYVLSEKN
jgi:peptidoglycan/LPS O-acetylase OafA/YrhL